MIACRAAHELWLTAGRRRARHYRRALHDPARTQAHYLRQLIHRNRATSFGKKHDFSKIDSVAAFQKQVPIRSYDDYIPWIDRIQRGQPHVLTREPVRRLIPTSGSTTGNKLIPYTASLQNEFSNAIAPWIDDLYCSFPSLKSGPGYWSISPPACLSKETSSAVPIGFDADSDYLGRWCSQLVNRVLIAPPRLDMATGIDAFGYLTLLFLLRERELRLISIWHASFLTALLASSDRWWETLCRDIAGGTASVPGMAQPIKAWQAGADPRRSRELAALGPDAQDKLWPRLAVLSCWTDAQAAHASDELCKKLGQVQVQGKGLIATEAFISLPYENFRPLAVRSHFFEFIDGEGQVKLAHELKTGDEYQVVVTTGGGLYRYRMGDRVRVDGFVHQVPSVTFLGRDNLVSDLVGEKLSDSEVARVIQSVLQGIKDVRFAMLAPEKHEQDREQGRWGYVLYLDCPKPLPAGLDKKLEKALSENFHYRYAAALGQLQPAILRRTPSGALAGYTKRLAAQGVKLGDIKPVSLSRQSDWHRWLNPGG